MKRSDGVTKNGELAYVKTPTKTKKLVKQSAYYYIEVVKGVRQWRWMHKASNGQVLAVSQRYFSKWTARRAARKIAKANDIKVRVQK